MSPYGAGADLHAPSLGCGGPAVHIAFASADRRTVDAFYHAALTAGGTDNGAPGLRPKYHPNYYGAFVLDPDGYNIEAVCHKARQAGRASREKARSRRVGQRQLTNTRTLRGTT